MRVTNQMMSDSLLQNLGGLRSRSAVLTQQLSSGERITKVSEDPATGLDIIRAQSRMQVMDQWGANLQDAKEWAVSSSDAFTHLSDLMLRAKELAVQGANGSFSPQDQKAMAIEIDALVEDALHTMNGKGMSGALFGGHRTDQDPFTFDKTTGTLTYNGDTGAQFREVGPGTVLQANVDGTSFGTAASNPLKALWDMSQQLKAGNTVSQTAHAAVQQALDDTLALRTRMGANEKRLDQLESRLQDTKLHMDKLLQTLQGVDMEKAIMELNNVDTAYRAALQIGAKIIPQTLADFLR